MHVKTHRRIISALLALSMLVSVVTPAFAQEQWPSGRGAAGPAAPAAPPVAAPERGAVSAQGLATDVTAESSSTLPPGVRRVTPEEAAQMAGQIPARDWTAPRGATIPAGRTSASAPRLSAAEAAAIVDVVVHLDMPSLTQKLGRSSDGAARAAYAAEVAREQARVGREAAALGGTVVYPFTTLSSGLAVQAPAGSLASLANIPGVSRVSR
jgi:hypothetical protein